MAHFRTTFLPALHALFVHILLYAQAMGVLTFGHSSLDGTTIHADASKSRAIRDKRLRELASPRRTEVDTLCARTEHAEQTARPEGLVSAEAIAFRHERLANVAKANAVGDARAQERYAAEQAPYDATGRERDATSRQTGSHPRGRPPTPPTPGPRDQDQDNGTDPASRLMQNSHNEGCEPHDQAQAAVEQARCLLGASTLSTHPNDHAAALPTLDAIPPALGTPQAGALDHGDFSATTIAAMEARDIEPSSATGRIPHHPRWQS